MRLVHEFRLSGLPLEREAIYLVCRERADVQRFHMRQTRLQLGFRLFPIPGFVYQAFIFGTKAFPKTSASLEAHNSHRKQTPDDQKSNSYKNECGVVC